MERMSVDLTTLDGNGPAELHLYGLIRSRWRGGTAEDLRTLACQCIDEMASCWEPGAVDGIKASVVVVREAEAEA